jgi:hypothetical protein
MKLAVVYNLDDPKLIPTAYSWTYRDMLLAVLEKFAPVQIINENCEAASIEADAILFWDIHSSHHIEIKGIEKHQSLKLEYFNDPHQAEQFVYYKTGQKFHKLSAKQRTERAKNRGVEYIICPYKSGYEKYIAPYAGDIRLLWFPIAPKPRKANLLPLSLRLPQILASGHLWEGENDFRPYEFRNWAYQQKNIYFAEHSIISDTPCGITYQGYLSQFAAAFAFCDCYVVPKYFEIPMAGCLCFCQMLDEYRELGFTDGKNCISVTKENFNERVSGFLSNIDKYQSIADAGRMLALNYTADRFAEYLYKYLSNVLKQK